MNDFCEVEIVDLVGPENFPKHEFWEVEYWYWF